MEILGANSIGEIEEWSKLEGILDDTKRHPFCDGFFDVRGRFFPTFAPTLIP